MAVLKSTILAIIFLYYQEAGAILFVGAFPRIFGSKFKTTTNDKLLS